MEGEATNTGNGNTPNLPLEALAKRDYVLLIDRSGSMLTQDCPGGKSRWDYMQEQAIALALTCEKFDSDGIDVIVFAGSPKQYKGVTAAKVVEIFKENSPSGSTDTAAALKLAFDGYTERKKAGNAKPLTVVCVTDGEPTDQKAVDKVITDHANSLDNDDETGVTFIQIGKDEAARKFLQHLDDDLQGLGAKFDIVDTKNEAEMDTMSLTDVLVAAVTD